MAHRALRLASWPTSPRRRNRACQSLDNGPAEISRCRQNREAVQCSAATRTERDAGIGHVPVAHPSRGRCQRRAGAPPTCDGRADHVSSAAAPSRRTEYPTHCSHWWAPRPVCRKLPMPEEVEQSMKSIYQTRRETALAVARAWSARHRVVPEEAEQPQLDYDWGATRGDLLPMPDIRKAHHLESANGCFGFCGLSGPLHPGRAILIALSVEFNSFTQTRYKRVLLSHTIVASNDGGSARHGISSVPNRESTYSTGNGFAASRLDRSRLVSGKTARLACNGGIAAETARPAARHASAAPLHL